MSRLCSTVSILGQPAALDIAAPISTKRAGLPTAAWGPRDAVTVLGLAIVAIVVIRQGASLLPSPTPLTPPMLTLTLELCLFGLALAFSVWKYHLSAASFGFRHYRGRDRSLPLVGTLGMLGCVLVWQAMAEHVHRVALHAAPNLPTSAFLSPFATAVAWLVVCVAAPIAEETFFRGFLFRALLHKTVELRLGQRSWRLCFGLWPALVLSGALFAAAHLELALFVPFLATSALLTWLFWRSGSLWPAILAHGAFNSIQFALALHAHFP